MNKRNKERRYWGRQDVTRGRPKSQSEGGEWEWEMAIFRERARDVDMWFGKIVTLLAGTQV